MITSDEMVEMMGKEMKGIAVKFGKIDPNYTSGKPSVVFDSSLDETGVGTPSVKKYAFISSYTPKAGDRVMIINNVVIGRIANDGIPDSSL